MDAVLAKGITDANEPKEIATEFGDDTERIYVVMNTALPEGASFNAKWIALNAEDIAPNSEVTMSCWSPGCGVAGKGGARRVLWYEAPYQGFAPGD